MDIPAQSSVIDMNESWTLWAYGQMLVFRLGSGQSSLVFENPSHDQQDVLQSLAHQPEFGFEYEYNLVNRQAYISRPLSLDVNRQPESLLGQSLQVPIILDSLDLAIPQSNMEQIPLFGKNELSSFDEDFLIPDFSQSSPFTFESSSLFPNAVAESEQSLLEGFLHGHPSNTTLTKEQSNSMETALLRGPPQNVYLSRIGRPDRVGSISSQGLGRDGKALSWVSSSRSTSDSMFSCFDSKSTKSVVTETSTSTRRSRGAMDNIAKAAMNAVKAIGACWRCKLLRKQCDDLHRCENCPKGSTKSDWKLLGCRRGALEDNIVPVLLCPGLPGQIPESFEARTSDRDAAVRINEVLQLRRAKRDYDTRPENGAMLIGNLDSFLEAVDAVLSDANCNPTSYAVSIKNQYSAALQPLDECIKSIVWELSSSEPLQKIMGGFTLDSLTVLLRSASLHQAKTDNDQLIAQSLICLRESLEVLSLQQNKHLDGFSHLSCTRKIDSTDCSIKSMANLEGNISRYIQEFSRVLFRKERMRNVKSWWLSVFYSLCIQNFVRQALLRLEIDVSTGKTSTEKSVGAKQYLYLALRLFSAYSRKYDPLVQKSRMGNCGLGKEEDELVIARLALECSTWSAVGIGISKDYLKMLFEDEGCRLY